MPHEDRARLSSEAATLIADLEVNPTLEGEVRLAKFIVTSPDHLGAYLLVSAGLVALEAIEAERRAALARLTKAPALPLRSAIVTEIGSRSR